MPYSTLFLDRTEFYLAGEIWNENQYPLSINSSFHSLISEIKLLDGNNNALEINNNYAFLVNLHLDQTLSRSERLKRKADEGFGVNTFVNISFT